MVETTGLAIKLTEDYDLAGVYNVEQELQNSLLMSLRMSLEDDAFGDELVLNGDFLTYTTSPGVPDSWANNIGAASEKSSEPSIFHDAANALKITVPGGTVSSIKQTLSGLVAGRSYRIRAWVRTGGGSATANLFLRNTTDAVNVVAKNSAAGSTSYTEVSGTFQVISGKSYDIILEASAGGGNIAYFDDVSLVEIRAIDASGYGNHGILFGGTNTEGPTVGVAGKIGEGYTFDGSNDWVRVAHTDDLDFRSGDPFSIELWFKTSTIPGSTTSILEKWSGSGGYPFVIRTLNDGRVQVANWNGSSGTSINTAGSKSDGNWHHLIFSSDGGDNLYLWMDNVVASAPDTTTGEVGNTSPIGIGSRNGSQFWTGTMDEVRIYDRLLSASEVATRYNAGLASTRLEEDDQAPEDPYIEVQTFHDFDIVEGVEEVEQAIHVRLRTRRGEDIISPSVGLPIDAMMGIRTPAFIEGTFREELLKDPRVSAVQDFDLNLDPQVRRLDTAFSVVLKDTTTFTVEEKFGV